MMLQVISISTQLSKNDKASFQRQRCNTQDEGHVTEWAETSQVSVKTIELIHLHRHIKCNQTSISCSGAQSKDPSAAAEKVRCVYSLMFKPRPQGCSLTFYFLLQIEKPCWWLLVMAKRCTIGLSCFWLYCRYLREVGDNCAVQLLVTDENIFHCNINQPGVSESRI